LLSLPIFAWFPEGAYWSSEIEGKARFDINVITCEGGGCGNREKEWGLTQGPRVSD